MSPEPPSPPPPPSPQLPSREDPPKPEASGAKKFFWGSRGRKVASLVGGGFILLIILAGIFAEEEEPSPAGATSPAAQEASGGSGELEEADPSPATEKEDAQPATEKEDAQVDEPSKREIVSVNDAVALVSMGGIADGLSSEFGDLSSELTACAAGVSSVLDGLICGDNASKSYGAVANDALKELDKIERPLSGCVNQAQARFVRALGVYAGLNTDHLSLGDIEETVREIERANTLVKTTSSRLVECREEQGT